MNETIEPGVKVSRTRIWGAPWEAPDAAVTDEARERLVARYPSFGRFLDVLQAGPAPDMDGELERRGIRFVEAIQTHVVDTLGIARVGLNAGRADDQLAAAAIAALTIDPRRFPHLQFAQTEAATWLGAYSIVADLVDTSVTGWLLDAWPAAARAIVGD